jgi:hypothetical protein
VQGFVNAVPDFTDHPAVINGASDLFIEVFGQANGSHSRSASDPVRATHARRMQFAAPQVHPEKSRV